MSAYRQAQAEVTALTSLLASHSSSLSSLPPLPPPGTPISAGPVSTADLLSLQARADALLPSISLFTKNLTATDPVTGKDRYGDGMKLKVRALVGEFEALTNGAEALLAPGGAGEQLGRREEAVAAYEKEREAGEAAEGERLRREAAESEEAVRRREEEAALAREAEAERERQRVMREFQERERREKEAAARAREEELRRDREWVASIPKGLASFRELFSSLPPPARKVVATLFAQIKAHPDNESFRRFKLAHPRFQEDVARHPGGRECFVAAGFGLQSVESESGELSKCLVMAEPSLENDFDGWSEWFNLVTAVAEACGELA
ncbi:hypothetical protein TeGR_g5797 [Tetraparma gracilis]|uniref:PUB domain-containing protein n=1 Tax=Tetraparma gracilis TaxID=2962635 RepID=A0ABQ6MLB5_9STRA|nr:hypothetical protein TeGR_g5797 [Tetraparma gracilis]